MFSSYLINLNFLSLNLNRLIKIGQLWAHQLHECGLSCSYIKVECKMDEFKNIKKNY
jgi:hypothetical protein